MFKLKLLFEELRRAHRRRRCEHEWVVPRFYANQKEYRVFCPKCGKELWWGGEGKNERTNRNKAKSVVDKHKGRNSSTYKDVMKEYPEIYEAIVKTLQRKAWNEREGEGDG